MDTRDIARETLEAASLSRHSACAMKNSDDEQRQLFKDELLCIKTKTNAENSLDTDNPHLMVIELSVKLG